MQSRCAEQKEEKNRPFYSPALERRLGIFAGTGRCGGLSNIESTHYLCVQTKNLRFIKDFLSLLPE